MSSFDACRSFVGRVVRRGLALQVITAAAVLAQVPSTLRPFRSDADLASYLREAIRAQAARRLAWTSPPPCKNEKVIVNIVASKTGVGPTVVHGRVRPAGADSSVGLQEAVISIQPLNMTAASAADGSFTVTLSALAFPDSLQDTRSVTLVVRRIGFTPAKTPLTLHRGDRVELDVPLCGAPVQLESVVIAGTSAADESITNAQQDGVDEGGIVKRLGEYLVVLRRGRLFTIDVSRGGLRPIDASNAYGPG